MKLTRDIGTSPGRVSTGSRLGAGSICASRYCTENEGKPSIAKRWQYSAIAVVIPVPSEKTSPSFDPR
jgi:hypothetical protein